MSENQSIAALIRDAKAGDERAFRELYDQLIDRVFLFVRARTRSREDALEIVQDTFVDLWRALGTFEYSSVASTYAYLYRIASRKISKHYRLTFYTVSLVDVDDVLRDPEDVDCRAEATYLVHLLQKLGARDREVIELRYFGGMQFEAIAEMLDQNESAVKVRHHRAIKKLKAIWNHD